VAKNETGITDTGEQPDPVNRKVRRTTSGWQSDTRAAIGDGMFPSDGTRRGQQRPVAMSNRRRRGAR
jgi:hypothetical protein